MSGGANGAPRLEPLVAYLDIVEIENVKSIASLRWEVKPEPGWNVVLGENGAGKTTFLKAIVMVLLADNQKWLRLNLDRWLRSGASAGRIAADVRVAQAVIQLVFQMRADERGTFNGAAHHSMVPAIFFAALGPFRRFTGRDSEYDEQFEPLPRLARVISLFDERFTLGATMTWLKQLQFKRLEGDGPSEALLDNIQSSVNREGFLPNEVRLKRITSEAVIFADAADFEIPIEELSDGYRSILSLTFTLIRQLVVHYGPEQVFDPVTKAVKAPGIVLIDEADIHLHPSWQRRIGLTLRDQFPAIQFIVTTHSPIICQAATAPTNTVFRLPRPGVDEEGRMVTGAELGRLLYGDLADAYATDAMGHIGRSETAYALLDQLALLNRKEIDAGLTDDEEKEQRRLRRIFGAGPLPEKHP